jgi:hypothetical protein
MFTLAQMREWIYETIVKPTSKMETSDIGKCLSLGIWGGMFPCPGVTTLVVILLVFVLPNKFTPAMKAIAVAMKFVVSPLHYLMIPIFMTAGGFVFPGLECDPMHIVSKFVTADESFVLAIQESAACLGAGVVIWTLATVPAMLLLYAMIVCIVHVYRKVNV